LRRFLRSSRIRAQILTALWYKDQHFQRETFSCEDRYPDLFAECRNRIGDRGDAKVLSFGCSTGSEVFSLARYLPQAEITGVDLNVWCLKQCSEANSNSRLRFLHRFSSEFADSTGFDAIFCMAVFQRTEHRTANVTPGQTGFTFERFEDEVRMLDRKLKIGGVLLLDQCDFPFEQTDASIRYTVPDFEANRVLRQRPLFGKDNQLITNEHYSPRCFLKMADA
jgi:hypothetical protein